MLQSDTLLYSSPHVNPASPTIRRKWILTAASQRPPKCGDRSGMNRLFYIHGSTKFINSLLSSLHLYKVEQFLQTIVSADKIGPIVAPNKRRVTSS